MRILAFDTSTAWMSVAIGDGTSWRVHADETGPAASERLLPAIDAMLRAADVSLVQLDAIAFGAGPGSFTGLRIACGLAQGFAFAHGLPVLGVSTLEAIAEEAGAARVVACIDARMREVYYAALENRGGRWHDVIAAQCVPPDAAPKPPGEGWIGAGSGFGVYGDFGLKRVRSEVHPTAAAVARLAAPRLAAGEGVDAALAVPVYLRDKVALTVEEQRAEQRR
jgi:tRNA threonylcarbamoyladenosine biosynthesis protein TsaB